MSITRSSIDRVIEAADLVDLIGSYVTLKKKGVNFEACCPFHEEKTPSFKVNPVKGIYKCFGCGKGGDAISFVMDIEPASYVEAIRLLATRYHVELEETRATGDEDRARQSEKESLEIVVAFAQDYFKKNLHEHPEGKSVGMTYFIERGLQADIIDSFGLGYAIDQWDGLLQEAARKQYNPELLEKAGLILVNEETHKTYDRFRGRVTFPISSVSGKVIGFGARMLGNDKNQPKYINSPDSPLYDKSRELYGLFQARQAIRQADLCFLTEGYMDVIAMHQAGIAHTVASSGTSLTEGQIKLISRFTRNLTLLYDGDQAGIKASLRAIDLILAAGLNVRAVVLPDGHDPDSYTKAFGSQALEEYLRNNQKDFISFRAGLTPAEDLADPIKKSEVIDSVLESLTLIPDVVRRNVFAGQAARLFGVPEQALLDSLTTRVYQKLRRPERQQTAAPEPGSAPPAEPGADTHDPLAEAREEVEKQLVRHLLLYGKMVLDDDFRISGYLEDQLQDVELRTPGLKDIWTEYYQREAQGEASETDYFLHHSEETIKRLAIDLCAEYYQLSPNWEARHKIYVPTEKDMLARNLYLFILHLKRQHIREELRRVEQELNHLPEEDDGLELLASHKNFKEMDQVLSRELGLAM